MNSSSHAMPPRMALAILVLAAMGCSLPAVIQSITQQLFGPTPAPTQMPPTSSTLLLNDITTCRVQPQDSAAPIVTIQAGANLPIIAQYQWWYLVQVQLSASQYNRCWINPTASTVQGPVASIPVVTDPREVPLLPPAAGNNPADNPAADDRTSVPITGGNATPAPPGIAQPSGADVTPPTADVVSGILVPPTVIPTTDVDVIPGLYVAPTAILGSTPGIPIYGLPVLPTGIIVPPCVTACGIYPTKTPLPPIIFQPTFSFIIYPTKTPLPPVMINPTLPLINPTKILIVKPTNTPQPPVMINPTLPMINPTMIIIIKPTNTPAPPPVIVWPTMIIVVKPTPTP